MLPALSFDSLELLGWERSFVEKHFRKHHTPKTLKDEIEKLISLRKNFTLGIDTKKRVKNFEQVDILSKMRDNMLAAKDGKMSDQELRS